MARGRMINRSICESDKFHRLPDDTCRLFATWSISHLDIRGVYRADPTLLKSRIFPRRDDVTSEEIRGYLDAIEAVGLIVRFEANGEIWQYWPGFPHNQVGIRYDRELPEYPAPPGYVQPPDEEPEKSRNSSGKLPPEEKRKERKRKEENDASQKDAPSRHPAIEVYRTKALRYPDKASWPIVEANVGTDEASLKKWGETVTAYISCGWNKLNVSGMVDFYKRGETPGASYRERANGNFGHADPIQKKPTTVYR